MVRARAPTGAASLCHSWNLGITFHSRAKTHLPAPRMRKTGNGGAKTGCFTPRLRKARKICANHGVIAHISRNNHSLCAKHRTFAHIFVPVALGASAPCGFQRLRQNREGLAETRIPRKHPGPRQNGTVPERAGVQDGFLSGTPCTSNRFLRPLNRPCGVQDASYGITPCTSERKKPLADRRNLPVLRRLNGSLVSICFLPNVVLRYRPPRHAAIAEKTPHSATVV